MRTSCLDFIFNIILWEFFFPNLIISSKSALLTYFVWFFKKLETCAIFSKPITNLIESANEISKGNFDAKVSEDDQFDEIKILLSSYNKMINEIKNKQFQIISKSEEDETKRFISKDKTISEDKIAILKGVSIVIKSGMDILGVSTPERM